MNLSIILVIFCSIFALSAAQVDEKRIAIEGTVFSVKVPSGFVLNNSVYTDSPSIHFSLPKRLTGDTPGYPSLSVMRVKPTREPDSLEAYVKKLESNRNAKIFLMTSDVLILGQDAVEIGVEWTTIFSLAGGADASAQTTRHEIIFHYQGHYYICALEAYPEIHERWVGSLRELCDGLRQDKSQN